MADKTIAASVKAPAVPAKEAGQVLISNTSMVNIRFTKRKSNGSPNINTNANFNSIAKPSSA